MYEPYDPHEYLFTHHCDSAVTQPLPVYTEPVTMPDPDLACETTHDNQLSYRESMGLLYAISFILPIVCTLGAGFIGFVVGALLGMILGFVNLGVYLCRLRAIRNGNVDARFSQGEIHFHNAVALGVGAMVAVDALHHLERRHAELQNGQGS
jgi:hypothetical protein